MDIFKKAKDTSREAQKAELLLILIYLLIALIGLFLVLRFRSLVLFYIRSILRFLYVSNQMKKAKQAQAATTPKRGLFFGGKKPDATGANAPASVKPKGISGGILPFLKKQPSVSTPPSSSSSPSAPSSAVSTPPSPTASSPGLPPMSPSPASPSSPSSSTAFSPMVKGGWLDRFFKPKSPPPPKA